MTAVIARTKPARNDDAFPLFREEAQRYALFLMFAVVSLWVSVDVTDSTILKPYFLIASACLLVSLQLARSLATGELSWRRTIADPWIVLYLLILVLSWAFSEFRIFGTTALLLSFASAVCFFSGAQLFGKSEKMDTALNVLATISFLICVVAVVQFLGGDQIGIDFGLGPARRVVSTLGNATYLAGFLAMMTPVALGMLFQDGTRRRRILLITLLVLLVITIFLTQSRGGILAFFSSVFLFIVLYNRGNPRRLFLSTLGTVTACLLLLFFVPGLADRLISLLNPMEDHSFSRRMPFWSAGWEASRSAPLLGHGPGSIPFVVAEFRRADYWMNGSEDIVPHVHNELLEAAVESGFAGAALLCGILVLILLQGWRSSIRTGSTVSLGILCGIVAIVVDNTAGVSLRHPPVGMVAWFLAGLLFSPLFQRERTAPAQFSFTGNRFAAFLPLAAWILIVIPLAGEATTNLGADASMQSGLIAARAGKHQIAVDHFRAAVRQDSTMLIASYELCVAQLRTGAYRDALRTIDDLRKFAPSYPKMYLLESLAWLEIDSLRLARTAIEQELRKRDHPEAFYTQSLIAARMDDTSGVRSSLEKVLERNIASYTTIHLEGTCRTLLDLAEKKEDLERLGSLLEQLAERVPRNKMIDATLAEVRRRLQERSSV